MQDKGQMLDSYGGTDNCAQELHERWPKACVYTSMQNAFAEHTKGTPDVSSKAIIASRRRTCIPMVEKGLLLLWVRIFKPAVTVKRGATLWAMLILMFGPLPVVKDKDRHSILADF